ISVDMEGIAGVVTADQLGPTGFEYNRFREFMTSETVAAVNAAKEAGATDIVVSDSHGNGENLLIEKFPADVQIVRSWPRPLMMMQGIASTFAAAIFERAYGFHSAITLTPEAAQSLIAQRVKAALARRSQFKPYVLRAPVQLDLTLKNYRPAELLAYLPFVRRTSAHSIQITGSIL